MEITSNKRKIEIEVLDFASEQTDRIRQDAVIIYVLEGSIKVVVDNRESVLKKEDVMIINANKKYKCTASKDVLYTKTAIVQEIIKDVYNGINTMFWCDSSRNENEHYEEIRSTLKNLLLSSRANTGRDLNFEYISQYYHLLEVLSINFLLNANNDNGNEMKRPEKRIAQIESYMQANYAQAIGLKDMAEQLYLTPGYLSRFFKQHYGTSFSEYLMNIRLYHVMDELLYTDNSITYIAYNNGFSSVPFFNRVFKKTYGQTPSEVRKNSIDKPQNVEKETYPEAKKRLEKYLYSEQQKNSEEKPSGKIVVTCESDASEKIPQTWNEMINIGSAADLLKNEVREHVILLRESLHYKYIRFWHIFTKEMLIDVNGNGKYNFSKLDMVLDFILQSGLKPFMEIEEKPRRINENVSSTKKFEENKSGFSTVEQWERLIRAAIKHWVKRYGVEEIKEWKIELWYEDYLDQKNHVLENYFLLFNKTYQTIKAMVPQMEIGGCGYPPEYIMETGYDPDGFYSLWSKQECQPDFISVLIFPYEQSVENKEKYSRISTDGNFLLHSIKKVKRQMEKGGIKTSKIYVTEWNLSVSDRNYINDTCYKGAYVVKNIIDVYDKVDMIGYFTGSDRYSEYYDSDKLLYGGGGLLSNNGILKPAAYAVEFFNRLYPYFVNKGNNYLITSNNKGDYSIVCHNQKSLNYSYFLMQEERVKKEYIERYFESQESLNLSIVLNHVENGEYLVKIYRINENSGSVLDIWKEMKYHENLSREDIKYFRRVCEPRLQIEKFKSDNNKISLNIALSANEIALLMIELAE